MKKARIEVIDIAKAATIFLVIVGHTTGDAFYKRVIYSFHMPLFFMLSGISAGIKPIKVHNFIRKNICAVVVPFVIWGLIYSPFSFRNLIRIFYASWESLGAGHSLTSLWFLSCLFTAKIITQASISQQIISMRNLPLQCVVMSVPLFAAGFMMVHPKHGMPWCFDIALVASGFILLGMAFRKFFIILTQQRMLILCITLAFSLAVFSAGTIFRGNDLELIFMCAGDYGSSILRFMINSLAGIALILSLSSVISRVFCSNIKKHIAYIGRNTMGIFLIHKHIVQKFMSGLTKYMPDAPLLLSAVTASVMALIASVIVCVIIWRHVPQMLGRFPRNENQATY